MQNWDSILNRTVFFTLRLFVVSFSICAFSNANSFASIRNTFFLLFYQSIREDEGSTMSAAGGNEGERREAKERSQINVESREIIYKLFNSYNEIPRRF